PLPFIRLTVTLAGFCASPALNAKAARITPENKARILFLICVSQSVEVLDSNHRMKFGRLKKKDDCMKTETRSFSVLRVSISHDNGPSTSRRGSIFGVRGLCHRFLHSLAVPKVRRKR